MQAILNFPDLSPELFSVSLFGIEFALRWYALAYIAGLLLGWRLVVAAVKAPRLWPGDQAPMTPAQVEQLLTWVILGVILGGRLGFVIFYKPGHYLSHPWEIPMLWQGGMAFHGGLLGVIVALVLFTRHNGIPLLSASDALAMATPPGLLFGRIANFINAELWGRPSDVPWAVVFPGELAQYCPGWDQVPCARHPSQLYEAALEGLVLGAVVLWLAWRRDALKRPGWVAGVFFIGYGLARICVEFFRQADFQFVAPDNPMGYAVHWDGIGLTQGQLLSLPMVAVGLIFLAIARRRA
ncbi:phosphatidylglycerol:prolipoprotein diacylglycerol transferase [Rhodovulum iodosum]|uniref:Phosphatidylglycerol--prolipoprotein diacylglyceryl transferase n=1 Tax=Rhodovulum iodosum TaxID=68291 RepID=A0ABV3XR36_9RHOB|nr:prolipoprotein diacylglyceryl transferase [Rhodovulum robiginosum]RSK32992.1 prolipoprotein diacylglyceryl transferase [Rhodovulum robiginosum]